MMEENERIAETIEFESIIVDEINNLSKELEAARQKLNYYDNLYPNMSASTKYYYIPGNDYHKTELKISLLNNKISILRALIELPKYARIQAMSDIEVEEYKKNKINELEGKIKEIEIIKEENKKTVAQLHER